MSNFAKTIALALTVLAVAPTLASAGMMTKGLTAACQTGTLTPNGLWDCR